MIELSLWNPFCIKDQKFMKEISCKLIMQWKFHVGFEVWSLCNLSHQTLTKAREGRREYWVRPSMYYRLIYNKSISLFFAYNEPPPDFQTSRRPCILCNFSMRTQKYFYKNFNYFFCTQKVEKPPQKVAYLWQLGGFFLCSPDFPK